MDENTLPKPQGRPPIKPGRIIKSGKLPIGMLKSLTAGLTDLD
jgi:hypothetical protein